MTGAFVTIATGAIMAALAVGQWIDRQCHGAALQEWREQW